MSRPAAALTGVFPIAPTPFTPSGDVDLDGQRRVLDCMVDQGVDGICILANYSEQFLLTDAERDALLRVCLEHVAGRVPVIVTCSHFSTRIAVERARAAAAAGAAMLMLMPPYHGATLRADEAGTLEQFRAGGRRGEASADGAGRAAVRRSALGRLPRAARARSAARPLLQDRGAVRRGQAARAARGGRSVDRRALRRRGVDHADGRPRCRRDRDDAERVAARPDPPVVVAPPRGRRSEAAKAYARILPLINYENRQCGLRATKTVMMEGGVIASDAVRHPLEPLHPATRAGLLELAAEAAPLVLRWGR